MSTDLRQLAHRLSYAALLPLVLGAGLIWLFGGQGMEQQYVFVSFAVSTYAGLVIAMLGGLHWGLSFARGLPLRGSLVWGAAAMSMGWVGVLMPPHAGLALHGGVLIACYLVDRRLYPQLGAGGWLTLRFRLTVVAALSCFLAAAGS